MNECTAQRWFKRSASGNLSLEDEQRTGRPRIWDSEATKEAAEQPSTSTRRLSGTFGSSKSTIHHHLTSLGRIYKSCRVVPHELTAEQAQRRVEFCHKLLQLPKDHHFIKRILITCNEKWVYLNNLDLQKQWLDKGQLPVLVAKREHFEKEVLLCVWWNYEGLVYYELVPD
jgi:histone-lysine N-methyltransferase SETMAR